MLDPLLLLASRLFAERAQIDRGLASQKAYVWTKGAIHTSLFHTPPAPGLAAGSRFPTPRELLASKCRWFFWDPLALWPQLRSERHGGAGVQCKHCNQPVLAPDGWLTLPRKVADTQGPILLMSRVYACNNCTASELT